MRRRPASRAVVAAVLFPMVFGALVLWAFADRVDRVDAVPAAVVNLDEPVETGQGEDRQTVAAGRLLAAGLTSPDEEGERTLAWQLASADDASAGLREGRYHAVVTIPRDFSRTVAGLTREDPETARITVRSNDSSSALMGVVSDQLGEVATARLNQQISATFLEGMYARTGELRTSLGKAEAGASRLADGAVRLGEGSNALSDGAGELAGGLGALESGADRLADGAEELSDGAGRLATGSGRLGEGASELADGTGRLADGLGQLHQRTRPLPARTRDLAEGAGQLAEGVDGWAQVLRGWRQACEADPVLAGSHPRLCAATVQAVGVDGGNAEAMQSGSRQLAAGADRLADATPDLVAALEEAAAGAGRVDDGADRLAMGATRLDAGARRLAAGADELGQGAARLAGGADEARSGASRLADGSTEVAGGSARLSEGSRELADGLGDGVRQIPQVGADERAELARAVARPVVSDDERLQGVSPAGALVPGTLALALWLGAFVTYVVRRPLPVRELRSAVLPSRVALAGWLPGVLVGALQALLVYLTMLAFGVTVDSPVAVVLLLLVVAAAFTALNQAVVAGLGPVRGPIASITLTVLQAVSLGGLLPVEAAPGAVRALNAVLPVPLAAEGLRGLVLGTGPGSALGTAAGLAVWGAAAFAVTVVAARRRRRVTLSDVRRRVAARHGT
ncbi:MAG TPA: YhgE/Pip family protein [Nocardioidaceae bacterium]